VEIPTGGNLNFKKPASAFVSLAKGQADLV